MTDEITRDVWLDQRKHSIGASDAAAILGASPWKSAMDVWAEKTGRIDSDNLSDNEAVEWGIRLEGPIIEAFAEKTGRRVCAWPQFTLVEHPEYKWMTCTPDAIDHEDRSPVQIKTTSAHMSGHWDDEPPLHYQVQLQHEMAVTGAHRGTLVVLIGGQKLRWFDCERNDSFIEKMLRRLYAFWLLVTTDTMPEPDASVTTRNVLAKLFPKDTGVALDLRDRIDLVECWQEMATAKAIIKAAEAKKLAAENRLKAELKDASYAELADGTTLSYKKQTSQSYVVAEKSFRVLRNVKEVPEGVTLQVPYESLKEITDDREPAGDGSADREVGNGSSDEPTGTGSASGDDDSEEVSEGRDRGDNPD